jgi:hypothetical protein
MTKPAPQGPATIPATPIPAGHVVRDEVLIPAGHGRSIRVAAGEILQIVDVRGQQVTDIMAWRLADPDEYLSPGHTVSCLTHLVPREGEEIFSNHRRPLMRVRRDTVGNHDLIVPCCDPERYERDYGLADHRSCLGNIREGLALEGETWQPRAELAWNVFMNNVLQPDGSIRTVEPPHPAGSYIEFDVLDDLGVVASSCPQDLTACNGYVITEMAFRVLRPAG